MQAGFQEFYINGNKFSVFSTTGQFVTVQQRRWLSGGAFGSQGRSNTQAWFHNVSKANYSLAVKTYKLLMSEAV